MRAGHRVIICICAALMAACSSAPPDTGEVLDRKNQAAEYSSLGNAYYNRGDYPRALQLFRLALETNVAVDYEAGMVGSYNSIGKVYLAAGDRVTAQQYFSRASELAYELKDPLLIASSLNNLAEMHLTSGPDELEKARELLEEALQQLAQQPLDVHTSVLLHNLGAVSKQTGDYELASDYFFRALAINLDLKAYAEAASNCYLIASIHSKRREYQEALEYAARALEYDKKVENSPGIAEDLLALGIIHLKAGDNEKAYQTLSKSYAVFSSIGSTPGILRLLPVLITGCEQTGRNQEAEDYRRLAAELAKR
jgi:tetratricopeptide (TPR) repeat protein